MTKLSITAEGFKPDEDLEKYVAKKIPRVERRLSRQDRERATVQVHFSRRGTQQKKQSECSVLVTLANKKTVQATELTPHMYAAFDIAIVHVEQQLSDAKWHLESGSAARRIRKYVTANWLRP